MPIGDRWGALGSRLEEDHAEPLGVAVRRRARRRAAHASLAEAPAHLGGALVAEEAGVDPELSRARLELFAQRAGTDDAQRMLRAQLEGEESDGLEEVVDALLRDEPTHEDDAPAAAGRGRGRGGIDVDADVPHHDLVLGGPEPHELRGDEL